MPRWVRDWTSGIRQSSIARVFPSGALCRIVLDLPPLSPHLTEPHSSPLNPTLPSLLTSRNPTPLLSIPPSPLSSRSYPPPPLSRTSIGHWHVRSVVSNPGTRETCFKESLTWTTTNEVQMAALSTQRIWYLSMFEASVAYRC